MSRPKLSRILRRLTCGRHGANVPPIIQREHRHPFANTSRIAILKKSGNREKRFVPSENEFLRFFAQLCQIS